MVRKHSSSRLFIAAVLLSAWSVIAAEKPIAAGSEPAPAQIQKLMTVVWSGDVEGVKHLLDDGMDVNTQGKAGLTPWLAARLRGDAEMLAFLKQRGADTTAPMPPPGKIADAQLSRLVEKQTSGLAVLVAQNGKILFQQGYGLANIKDHVPVTTETKFRIGSITKQFTAAAILKLQEQGKLKVQDPLSKFIPDYPRGDEVTIHHLLTHTSGIHSFTGKPGFLDTVGTPVTTEDLINSFKNDPYDFNPGQKHLYNNSGYFLLGYIIEKVSGKSYGEFLRDEFFKPLGMTNTGVHRSDVKLENEALGYEFDEKLGLKSALNWDMSRAGGAGILYSTVEDLFRWNEGVFNGRVLQESSLKAAFTPVKTVENKADASDSGYGYGWAITKMRGSQEISHSGGLNGFTSMLLRLPREKLTVVVLANALPGPPGIETGYIAHQLTEFFVGEQLAPRVPPKVDKTVSEKSLAAFVGRYDYGSAIMTVEQEGKQLFAQLAGQPRFPIFPKSNSEFFWKVVEARVTFVKDSSGKVTKAIHHQNGATITAPRLADVKEIKVDPATYDVFLGTYDYGEGKSVLTVTRDGSQLFAQLTGQPKFEIFPKSPTEFFWKVVDAHVNFVKDPAGKVTKAIHHQGGRTFDAPKLD